MANKNMIPDILTFPVDGSADVHKRTFNSTDFERKDIFKFENIINKWC